MPTSARSLIRPHAKRYCLAGSIAALLTIAPLSYGQFVPGPDPITTANTTAQTLSTGTGTVTSTGSITVGGATNAVTLGNAAGQTYTLSNSGTIEQTGTGRAIRNNVTTSTITLSNEASGIIRSNNADAIAVSQAASSITLNNRGQIISLNTDNTGGDQAVDWAGITGAANTLNNFATGIIRANAADAVRPGRNGAVNNFGLIEATPVQDAGSASGSDGIQADETGVTIDNSGTVKGRHAITGGGTVYTISVTNRTGGIITGVNGSGVNIDGLFATSTAIVTNEAGGIITGTTDALSANGDGDGVDVDGVVSLLNHGTIQGLGAKGVDSGGLDNNSEGVAAGGGTITNFAGGIIMGQAQTGNPAREGRGILIDDGSNGSGVAITNITNAGTIRGYSGFAIKMVGNFADTVDNQAGGVLQGAGTGAAIQMGDGADQLTNAGTILGENGLAINLGDGDDSLTVNGGAAAITGNIDGGTGNNTAIFNPGAGQSFSFAQALTNFNSVQINSGTVILSGTNTNLTSTTINGGTLETNNTAALGGGALTVTNGKLVAHGTLDAQTLTWNGGDTQLSLVTGDVINVAGAFVDGGGKNFILETGSLNDGTYTLVTFGSTTYADATLFTFATLNPNVQLQGEFVLTLGSLQFKILGATATGGTIDNSGPGGIPLNADFTANGPVQTAGGNNTIKSLTFTPKSSLTIFNTLTVTQGPVNLTSGSQILLGSSSSPSGNLSASQLNVAFGATLTGNGTINGNLINSGLVSPGYSPGTITVSQDYRQTSSGTLRIEIGGRKSGEYDLLAVGGRAFLDGKLELIRLNNFKLRRGDKITFLTANQGVEGEFSSVSNDFRSSTILQPEVVYHDKSVSLELVRGSFEDYAHRWGLSPNQRAVAQALDTVSVDDVNHRALVFLDGRALSQLPGDFDKIAPEELTSIFTISTSLSQVQGTNLQRRTDDIRSGANGFSAGGLALNGQAPSYSGGLRDGGNTSLFGAAGPTGEGKSVKESKEPAPLEEKEWGAFLSGSGEWIDVAGDGNARGYDLTSGGFTLGLDYKVSPNFALGIAAGYAGTTADLTDDGRVWVNGGKLGLYATYYTGGFYVDGAVTGGYNSYDTKRSALQGTARGDTDGGELSALIGTGYDWKIGALSIGPTATFQYTYVSMDGYTEHGSLAPLDIESQETESVRSAFGLKASYDWKVGGVLVKPEVRAAWQHEYGDQRYDLSASFAGGAGDSFLVSGPEIGRDSLLVGAGVAVMFNDRTSVYAYYDGELGRERYERHSVSGGLRISF